ncbi:aminoacylase-1A-like isoform X2 [Rhodnius prolixus]
MSYKFYPHYTLCPLLYCTTRDFVRLSVQQLMEDEAVANLREYIRIPSVHPNVDYTECVTFIKRLAKNYGLPCNVFGKADKPVVILTWRGTDKHAGSILLNSHMDVVPVYKEKWSYDPFAAVKDDQGYIYGRGTQDTKSTGIQQISAVGRLKEKGISLKRTVHVSFVPDEEIGGVAGMGTFVKTEDFKKLNIAFAIDEGSPTEEDEMAIFNEERSAMKVRIHCCGPTGHGSLLLENTAGEKMRTVLNAFLDYRESQVLKMKNSKSVELAKIAEVTSINLTELKGGVQNNVVPPEIVLGFDVRLSVHEDHEQFFNWVETVCKSAGNDVRVEYSQKEPKTPKTAADSTNPFWTACMRVFDKMNIPVHVIPFYGCTDARYLRRIGVPSFGLTPMRNTPNLLHNHNEKVHESIFLEGLNVYANLIEALANV